MTDSVTPIDPASLAHVFGGSGAPQMRVGTEEADRAYGHQGNDAIDARGGDDTVQGLGGQDLLNGGDGNDLMMGGDGNDALHGGAGDDTFVWWRGDGSDDVRGGAGIDTLHIRNMPASLEEVLAMIVVEEGSPLPGLREGGIDLTGVRGSFVIGTERISFSGLEWAFVSAATGY